MFVLNEHLKKGEFISWFSAWIPAYGSRPSDMTETNPDTQKHRKNIASYL